jgi:hypothetical protein
MFLCSMTAFNSIVFAQLGHIGVHETRIGAHVGKIP